MEKRTKIIATIGPSSDTPHMIERMIKSGVSVFRFNMKHSNVEWHDTRIKLVQSVSCQINSTVGILIDLQGPEIRIETKNHENVIVKKNERVVFTNQHSHPSKSAIWVPLIVTKALKKGDLILIDDGFSEFTVTGKRDGSIVARALDDCVIKHRKGLNIPGKTLDLPSLIRDDLVKLDLAAKLKVDFIALSFSRTREDIENLRDQMTKRKIDAKIVAKIESNKALEHIDELIECADAIMVARGDLGVETPIEKLAFWQKQIITKCRVAKKPVIVATQMLQSMVDYPLPTRAEATDVANAVFDGTDAVMLSGETASGKYPLKAVMAMSKILQFNEVVATLPKLPFFAKNATELIIEAVSSMLDSQHTPHVDAVLVFTSTGYTARVLASLRSKAPIIAVSTKSQTVESLTLSYGVTAIQTDLPTGAFKLPNGVIGMLKKKKLIATGQNILIVHGQHWNTPGLTNAVALYTVK